jgi:hypothetical protein
VQHLLFPRKTIIEFPASGQTADARGEAEVEDRHRYYLKGDGHGRPIRANEWICTHLAEAVGIAAPAPAIIEMLNGDVVFGSRRIIGVSDQAETQNLLSSSTIGNASGQASGLDRVVAAIYAFDMFVFNVDRHLRNYLSIDDNGVRRFYAFDFGRGLFWEWPWVGYPGPTTWTRRRIATLQARHGFDVPAAKATLDQLGAVSTAAIEGFIATMPADWLAPQLHGEFVQWWSSGARQDRITQLKEGIENGTLV